MELIIWTVDGIIAIVLAMIVFNILLYVGAGIVFLILSPFYLIKPTIRGLGYLAGIRKPELSCTCIHHRNKAKEDLATIRELCGWGFLIVLISIAIYLY